VRWPALWLAGAALLGGAGCYRPRPLDARTVGTEVEEEQPPVAAARTGPAPATPATQASAVTTAAPGDRAAPLAPAASAPDDLAPAAPPDHGSVAPVEQLSEEQAVARALRFNPGLRAQRHQVGMAEGEITAATALSNPTVELNWQRLEAPAEHAFSVQLAWAPPQPELYAAKRDAARAGAKAVKSEIAESEWEVVTAVRSAHANLLALGEQRRLVEVSLAKRRRIEELLERRVRGGASTSIDFSLAQLSVAEGERQHEELAAQELEAGRQLAQLLGSTRTLRARGALPEESGPLPAYQALVDEALASRPSLTAEQSRFLQREEAIRVENARRWPWFELTSAPRYRYEVNSRHTNDFQFGVRFTVPILDQNAGPIRVAEAARDAEREQFRQQAQAIRREIGTGLDEVTQRRSSLERYRRTVLPSLDAHERLLNSAAQGGQLDVVAVLRAEDAILRSRSEFVALLLSHHQAWLRLDSATGRRVAAGAPLRSQVAPPTGPATPREAPR